MLQNSKTKKIALIIEFQVYKMIKTMEIEVLIYENKKVRNKYKRNFDESSPELKKMKEQLNVDTWIGYFL